MSLPGQVANWLFNVIQPQYVNKEVVYSDIYRFLTLHYRQNLNFKIRTRVYTWPDCGRSDLLLQLYSTLIVKDVEVPVEVWIPFEYPHKAIPIVYIIPDLSKNLYIKPNNHVDSSGKFYHPYLTDWYNHYSNSNQLNLINLIEIIYEEFSKDIPITNIQSAAPPKPVKYDQRHTGTTNRDPSGPIPRQSTGPPLNRQTTGPPIPIKPQTQSNLSSHQPNIPLKYQQPLPIPPVQPRIIPDTSNQDQAYTPQQPDYQPARVYGYHPQSPNPNHYAESPNLLDRQIQSPNYQSSNYQSSNHQSPNSYTPSPNPQSLPFPIKSPSDITHHPISPPIASPPLDLIDNQDKPSGISSNKQLLIQLSNKINEALVQENHHELVPKIVENSTKVEALYSQLYHHYEQGKANSENLNYHITYLNKQVENLTKFNQDLQKLDLVNDQQQSRININQTTSFELNELIIPDSILVKQLYDVVSEIKAIKDSIKLIGGSFPQTSELINDQNVDTCVKTVRGLSRELFWLELTKNEIARIMQLKE